MESIINYYYKIIAGWVILAGLIIYYDLSREDKVKPLSACHNAPIKVYYDRPMCTDCKLFCDIKDK